MATARNIHLSLESNGQSWDHVRVWKLTGREAISELFAFDLEVACDPDHELPDGTASGDEVSLVFEVDGEEVRRVHGVLGPIRRRYGVAAEREAWKLSVVPRASRLALVETQEIFLDLTIPEILESKLERHDLAGDFELRLTGSYPAREFVVQYRESDLAFVCRLAEHAGISFFFEHEGGKDRLILTDHEDGFPAADEALRFQGRGETGGVFALERVESEVPRSFIVQDYNYRAPRVELSALFELDAGSPGGVVDYGSHVKTPAEAEQLARIRAEERRADRLFFEGRSGSMGAAAGRRAALVDAPPGVPTPLLLSEVRHELTLPLLGLSADVAGEARYANGFRALPPGFTHRPKRRTPKPAIAGTVTGIIQPGPDGETGGVAQIDADGRYLVQIHFDTAPPGEQKASHRVRMAQPFAGPSYGMHMPLRRGTEVLLAFTNGDPDRPVIVGALYNASSPNPVVSSNANKHQIKSSTGALFELGSKS